MRGFRLFCLLAVSATVFVARALDPGDVVFSATFVSDGSRHNLHGTQLGMDVNMPDGVWKACSGWNWSQPYLEATWGSSLNIAEVAEERSSFAAWIGTTNSYVKPSQITLKAEFRVSQGTGGVGFWSDLQPTSGTYPNPDYDPAVEGSSATVTINYDGRAGFNGICADSVNHTLRLYHGGTAVGDAILVEFADTGLQTIELAVDTTTGGILFVTWNGDRLSGFPATTNFHDADTDYAGVMSQSGGRAALHSLEVSVYEPPPAYPIVTVAASDMYGVAEERQSVAVSAEHPDTGAAMAVSVGSTTATGYTFADGVFAFTPAAAGTYTVDFVSSNGSYSTTKTVTFHIYNKPASLPEPNRMILLTTNIQHRGGAFAGTSETRTDEATSADYTYHGVNPTDTGLLVNAPQTVWRWATGFNWATPGLTWDEGYFGFGDERSSILLSVQSNGDYAKPRHIYVEATMRFTGQCMMGFWGAVPDQVTQGLGPTDNFTGLVFSERNGTLRGYANGAYTEAQVSVPLRNPVTKVYTISFVVDTATGNISRVLWDGLLIEDFAMAGAFTDANTRYVGLGTLGNEAGGFSSRMTLRELVVRDLSPSVLMIIIR